jgi:hypothetical protein
VLVLLVLLFVLDRALGALAAHWYFKTRDGDTGGQINGLLASRSAVVVFGDSRAETHYDPGVLSGALGTTAFNAGFKGSNSIYFYGLEQLVLEHFEPRLIVLDFSPYAVDNSRDDPYQRLYPLYPYWRDPAVWPLIAADGLMAQLGFLSRLYPYNSKIHSILTFNLIGHRPRAVNGFDPAVGSMGDQTMAPLERRPASYNKELVSYLDKFIVAAHERNIPVVIVQSPRYALGSFTVPEIIQHRIAELAIPVIDYDVAHYPQFADHRLYHDDSHLNLEGAELFSRMLGARLCELYCQQLRRSD